MQYMVIMNNKTAFMTDWYTHENCWTNEIFCVVDTIKDLVTFDGKTWQDVDSAHLDMLLHIFSRRFAVAAFGTRIPGWWHILLN